MKSNIIQNTIITLSLLGIVACNNKSNSSDSYGPTDGRLSLSWDSEYVTMSKENSFATIDLKDRFDKEDTFDAHNLIGENYLVGSSLKIKIKADAEIVRAEKITHLYPTIWASTWLAAIQFIYLFDLEYRDVLPLQVTDGIIEYPAYGEGSSSAIKKYFDNISKNQILTSIDKVPEEFEKKGIHCDYEMDSWKKEAKVWKRIAQKYTTGEFTNTENEPFDIDPHEIELVVTFKGKNGKFTKTFHDIAVVGN